MRKIFFLLFLSINNLFAQNINITNPVISGRFNTCNMGLPVVTASYISGSGSVVNNGTLVCLNPTDSTLIRISINNLRWNKTPGVNWLHGLFFQASSLFKVTPDSPFPLSWFYMSTGCTGVCSGGGAFVGGPGYYFAGTGSSCCVGGGTTPNPCDNWGDPTSDCSTPFNISFFLKFKNTQISSLGIRFYGTADGNTGCWSEADATLNSLTFFLQGVACTPAPPLCNPTASTSFVTALTGPYQWQMSTDSLTFNNLSNDTIYSGVNTNTLALTDISSASTQNRYRCVANGITAQVFTLKFSNTWTGAINSDWNTAGNWSCGTVPDANTDVFINFGTVIISSNTSVRSLTIKPPGSLSVAPGIIFTVTN